MKKVGKREIATKQSRLYPSTLIVVQRVSQRDGKTIPRIIDELVKIYLK